MSVSKARTFFMDNSNEFSPNDLKMLAELVKADGRSGVADAFNKLLKSKKSQTEELERVKKLYEFQETIASLPGQVILGLDEVGRGPLAGPLTVGGVVLKKSEYVLGLNDSKQISPKNREKIASEIKENSIC